MRLLFGLFTVVLFLIAIAGLGYGALVVVEATEHGDRVGDAGILAALASALLPFLIGTIALGFVTVMMGIDQSRSEQLTALNTLIRINMGSDARRSGNGQS